jgi:DMSO/TMAO reductase YedYZ molybdopterin-dependent catalytic subunit
MLCGLIVRIDCADMWYEYLTIEDLLKPRVMLVLGLGGEAIAGPPRRAAAADRSLPIWI